MQWFDKIFHLQTFVYIKFHSDILTRFSPSFSRQVQRRRPLSRPVAPLTIRRRRLQRQQPPQPRRTSRLLQILWALLPKPCWPKCKQKCNYVLISKIAFACNKKLLGNILSWNQIILWSSIYIYLNSGPKALDLGDALIKAHLVNIFWPGVNGVGHQDSCQLGLQREP